MASVLICCCEDRTATILFFVFLFFYGRPRQYYRYKQQKRCLGSERGTQSSYSSKSEGPCCSGSDVCLGTVRMCVVRGLNMSNWDSPLWHSQERLKRLCPSAGWDEECLSLNCCLHNPDLTPSSDSVNKLNDTFNS